MKSLENFLLPESVNLSVTATKEEAVLDEIMHLLQKDPRISNWKKFCDSILDRPIFPISLHNKKSMIIYHGRTTAVKDLVMAVGRSEEGIAFSKLDYPASLFFVVGIPHELSNDYLRIMGAIARACGDFQTCEKLLSTENPQEFIESLAQKCEVN